jgi:hypothetical protein
VAKASQFWKAPKVKAVAFINAPPAPGASLFWETNGVPTLPRGSAREALYPTQITGDAVRVGTFATVPESRATLPLRIEASAPREPHSRSVRGVRPSVDDAQEQRERPRAAFFTFVYDRQRRVCTSNQVRYGTTRLGFDGY